jgi:hypothetical protein
VLVFTWCTSILVCGRVCVPIALHIKRHCNGVKLQLKNSTDYPMDSLLQNSRILGLFPGAFD